MTALAAGKFAQAGWAVLQIDMLGCGDSSGDFGDASWEDWLADLEAARNWLASEIDGPEWIWGLRAGCLLATEAVKRAGSATNLLFWQPVIGGKQHLTQFLRLQLANSIVNDASGRTGTQELRLQLLDAGKSLEIAGYEITPGLASGLDRAVLELPAGFDGQVICFEVCSDQQGGNSPALHRCISRWQESGIKASAEVAIGPPFWQTVEIEESTDLIDRSLRLLSEC